MKEVLFPYGKTKLAYTFGEELMGVLTTELEDYVPKGSPAELVEGALQNPIGTLPLKELAKGKKNIVIINHRPCVYFISILLGDTFHIAIVNNAIN